MTEIAELTSSDCLKLPAEVAARFRPSDRFMVWTEDDAMYLKRIAPWSVSSIVAEVPVGEPMSCEEINDLVHEACRERRSGQAVRVVIDTNAWVSGLLWQGAPWELLCLAEAGDLTRCTSPAILDELFDVLSYERLQSRLDQLGVTAAELIGCAMNLASAFEVPEGDPIVLADPDDDAFLQCAEAADAAYLVSGDHHLLDLGMHTSIPIITIRDFLTREFRDWTRQCDSGNRCPLTNVLLPRLVLPRRPPGHHHLGRPIIVIIAAILLTALTTASSSSHELISCPDLPIWGWRPVPGASAKTPTIAPTLKARSMGAGCGVVCIRLPGR